MFQIRWVWRNMDKKYRVLTIIGLFLSIVSSAALVINPFLTSRLVDEVIMPQNPDPLIPLLVAMGVVTTVRQFMRYACVMCLENASQNLLYNLEYRLFSVLQYQEMHFFDKHRTGDLMTVCSADIDWCRHFIAFIDYQVTDCVTMFVATLTLFFFVSWKLTLALLAAAPLLLVITKLYSKKVHPLFMDMRNKLSHMNTAAQENIAGNRVVKAFAREDYEKERFTKCNQEYRDANLDINKKWLTFFPMIELLANAMTILTIFLGGFLIITGDLTAGGLTIFTSLAWALANPMRNLGSLVNDAQRFFTSASKVIEIYYSRPLITDRPDAEDHPKMRGKITFDDVSFSFGNVKVLDHVSFEVQPGQTLAIMGPTGSGKTTVINLLARFYDVSGGRILVDDCDVRYWKLQQLRRGVGTALQDVFLFSDTIDGNIAFGNGALSEEQVHDYARRAAADEFISAMPEGYDTIVGERGVGLSGGQKQRIALARAMAMEPAILVLDDTTSAVDLETEKYIQEQLRQLPYDCTKIIIAQRISSVKDADHILVLQDGRIAEEGTHEELLQNGGYYWETYALQNDIQGPPPAPAAKGGEA